jgi:hypothetical protein
MTMAPISTSESLQGNDRGGGDFGVDEWAQIVIADIDLVMRRLTSASTGVSSPLVRLKEL